jgi:hypothetical protein
MRNFGYGLTGVRIQARNFAALMTLQAAEKL